MRFHLATLTLVLGLAAGTNAHAQNVSDPSNVLVDCATDSVATNVEGDAMPAPAAALPAPSPRDDRPIDLCHDASDPRCAPLSPSELPYGGKLSVDLQRFVGTSEQALPMASFVVLPSRSFAEPVLAIGPTGVRSSLDRPPRNR